MTWLTVDSQVKLFLSFAGAVTVLWAFVRWILRVQPRRQVIEVLKEERANLDEILFESLDRNPRNRDTFRAFVERVFPEIARTHDLAETNEDRIKYLEASLQAMGKSLADNVAQAMRDATKAYEAQTAVMQEMQREIRRLSDAYLLLDATVKQWDGHDRRNKPRG